MSSVIGLPLLFYLLYRGDYFLLVALTVLSAVGIKEFSRIIQGAKLQVMIPLLFGGVALLPLLYFFQDFQALIIFVLLTTGFCLYLYNYPNLSPLDLSLNLLGVFYVAGSLSYLLWLRALPDGFWLTVYVFVVVFSTDTGAYFIGLSFGKHKLSPVISPHKTWEGFMGGLFFSLLGTYILIKYVPIKMDYRLIYLAPLISVAGQMGDLFESSLKRYAKIKDSGNIIPGHGGVLDRFDSTLWAAPLTYLLLKFLERLS
jgi:phosphatidate cytidylyltransferase